MQVQTGHVVFVPTADDQGQPPSPRLSSSSFSSGSGSHASSPSGSGSYASPSGSSYACPSGSGSGSCASSPGHYHSISYYDAPSVPMLGLDRAMADKPCGNHGQDLYITLAMPGRDRCSSACCCCPCLASHSFSCSLPRLHRCQHLSRPSHHRRFSLVISSLLPSRLSLVSRVSRLSFLPLGLILLVILLVILPLFAPFSPLPIMFYSASLALRTLVFMSTHPGSSSSSSSSTSSASATSTHANATFANHTASFDTATTQAQYIAHALSAVQTLQQHWYNADDGLWNATGWWNSANCLTTLAEFAALDPTDANALNLGGVMSNTYTNAQKVAQSVSKAVDEAFMVASSYSRLDAGSWLGARASAASASGSAASASGSAASASGSAASASGSAASASGSAAGSAVGLRQTKRARFRAAPLVPRDGFAGFINNFYDDEGWWALALIRAYDVTRNAAYLASAQSIFADMQGGLTPTACGGGIWWSKDHTYKNAIANELYLAVAASLANRVADTAERAALTAAATKQWSWFRASGLINNTTGLINDGLTIRADGSCVNNGGSVWSYNQGVVVGALVELHRALDGNDTTLLPAASALANAAINSMSTAGILHESCEANNGTCGTDGAQFKGIFIRNLQYLYNAGPDADTTTAIRAYILQNADSIWNNARDSETGELGLVWSGPSTAGGSPTTTTHSSAMDCLVAAMAVF